MMKATKDQVQRIGTLRGVLRKRLRTFDEDEYYPTLKTRYGADSCKDLTPAQADEFLAMLQLHVKPPGGLTVVRRGHGTSVRGRLKYDDLGERPAYLASPKQLRMIEGMWAEVSTAPKASREVALNNFLHNRFGTDRIEWVMKSDVQKIVRALQAMKKQQRACGKPAGAYQRSTNGSKGTSRRDDYEGRGEGNYRTVP